MYTMKKLMFVASLGLLLSVTACNNNPPKEEPGVTVEGKKGGEMKVDKDKLEIEGKRGGELKIDSNGAKIEKPQK
jgi:hypothetical protein